MTIVSPGKVVKLKYSVELTTEVPRKLTSLIIVESHNVKGHQGIGCTVNMIRCYFRWVGMHRDVHQHVNSCKLCIQFLTNRVYAQPMHLEIPQVPFTRCAMDCIRSQQLQRALDSVLTFICLLTSYLITLPLKSKTADEVSVAYIKEILPTTSCPKFIL